jgi:sugar phosphate permease
LASAPHQELPIASQAAGKPKPAVQVGGAYANYLLGVLVLVYVINFLDRQIIAILAEDIKADLGVSDAEIGFLYGTAFAVFYAIFGIPLGRLADVWNRSSLIAIGLGFWSLMTAFSGFARNFGQLAAARIGVGVGEASASPAAFSMLSDSFPARRRATVLALYSIAGTRPTRPARLPSVWWAGRRPTCWSVSPDCCSPSGWPRCASRCAGPPTG